MFVKKNCPSIVFTSVFYQFIDSHHAKIIHDLRISLFTVVKKNTNNNIESFFEGKNLHLAMCRMIQFHIVSIKLNTRYKTLKMRMTKDDINLG